MNWLGTAYLVLAVLTLMVALAHAAQAAVIRTDPVPPAIAAASLGFAFYGFGYAVVRGAITGVNLPLAHASIGLGLIFLCVFIPVTGWMLLELPLTRPRLLIAAGLLAFSTARLVDIVLNGTSDPSVTALTVPSGLTSVVVAGVWTVESYRSIRRGTAYARTMTAFGVVGLVSTVPGVLVTFGMFEGPDLFGATALPFIGFINTLTTLRYVHALKHANQPAGDIDRYQVLTRLGSGGMGDVFLARRRGPAGFLRDVVLKTLRNSAGDETANQRFLAEARLAAQLRHPNIVDVYDLGEQPGGFFIVMEHIEGPTLGQLLARSEKLQQPVPSNVAAEIGLQLCRALDFAHAAGVIHRDLKPHNVMLTYAGMAKLIDFGIAHEQRNAAPEEGVAGTQGYISPERLCGGAATPASDLFALGVVLYQVLTWRHPFPQANPLAAIAAVQAQSAPPLHELRGDCAAPLLDAIGRCLRYEPSERPRSAASLAAELEDVLHGVRVDLAGYVATLFPRGSSLPPGPAPAPRAAEGASTVTSAKS